MSPQLKDLLDLTYHAGVLKRGDYDQMIQYLQARFEADEVLMAEAKMEHGRLEALNDHCLGDLQRRDRVQDVHRRALSAALTS